MEFLVRDKGGRFYSKEGWVEYDKADILNTSSPQDQEILRKYLGGEYQIVENIKYYS